MFGLLNKQRDTGEDEKDEPGGSVRGRMNEQVQEEKNMEQNWGEKQTR